MIKPAIPIIKIVVSIYLLICCAIFLLQNQLLFPAHAAAPVAQNWVPNLSKHDTQAMIDGQCGKLHVVIWPIANAKGSMMLFHGNGESIASLEAQVPEFQNLGYSVMAWDYPSYGKSTSCWFNQKDLLRDSESAYQWLAQQTPKDKIILYGRSIGTGLALHVASQHQVKLVLLVSPYDALVKVASDHLHALIPVRLLSHLPIPAEQWVTQITSPIYGIHGTNDTLIRPERAQALFQHAKSNAQLDWIKEAGHNDILQYPQYQTWLIKHLNHTPLGINP